MSFILQAPHYLIQTSTVLPNPRFQDSRNLTNAILNKTMMDGSKRVYKRSTSQRQLDFRFLLHYQKALELEAFIEAYYGEQWRIITHANQIWRVYYMPEISDITKVKEDVVQAALTFEGVRLA